MKAIKKQKSGGTIRRTSHDHKLTIGFSRKQIKETYVGFLKNSPHWCEAHSINLSTSKSIFDLRKHMAKGREAAGNISSRQHTLWTNYLS